MSLRAFFQKPFSELILQPPPIGSRHLLFVNLFTLGMVLSLFTNKEQEVKKKPAYKQCRLFNFFKTDSSVY